MVWEAIGAIAGIMSLFLTLAIEWDKISYQINKVSDLIKLSKKEKVIDTAKKKVDVRSEEHQDAISLADTGNQDTSSKISSNDVEKVNKTNTQKLMSGILELLKTLVLLGWVSFGVIYFVFVLSQNFSPTIAVIGAIVAFFGSHRLYLFHAKQSWKTAMVWMTLEFSVLMCVFPSLL